MMKQFYLKAIAIVIMVLGTSNAVRANDYYLKSSGGLTTLSSWNSNAAGTGTTPASFSGNHVWHFTNRTGASLTNTFPPPNTATVIVESAFNLSVSTTFGQINSKIDIASTGSLTIINAKVYNFNILDANSTVTYSFATATVKPANYGNLVVAVSTSLNASAGGNIWVYGTLTLNSGVTLNMNGYGMQLNGSSALVAGTGSLMPSATSFIECYGGNGGNNGTLNFAGGSATMDYLYLQFGSPTDYITLGSDLTISNTATGTFFQSMGGLNLNGKTLTIDTNADISFVALATDGMIMGSAASAILVKGSVGAYSGATDIIMDAANNTLKYLALDNAASTLGVGSALIITDSLSVLNGQFNTNGNVTLKSTSALKGRLGRVGGTLNGNLTVQTFAKGGSTGWAELGAGGLSGLTFNSWYGQIPMAIEGSPTGVTSAGNYYFESVQGWNEADAYGYDTTITVTSPINVGSGYWVYLGTGPSTTTDMTWSASGTPVTGNVTIPLTFNAYTATPAGQNGDNLIANPYASPISWTKLRNANVLVNNAIYIYNADGGVYASYVNGAGTNGGSDIIPAGQGFYISALGNTNLTATEAIKMTANTSANELLRSSNSQSTNYGQIFKLKINGTNGDFDETAFRFHTAATTAFDQEWDARKIFVTPGYAGYPGAYSYYTTISSKSGNQDYSINSLPDLSVNSYTIPVLAKVMSTGSYTIAPIDLQNFTNPSCFVLRDKLLNVNHNLANGPYVCTISDTTSAPRFELVVCQQSMPTGVANNSVVEQNSIQISQDVQGAFVKTSFDKSTRAVISVYNIVGQQLMNDITVNGTENTTYLNLNLHNQVVMIRVTTDKESVVKKIVLH